MKKILLSTLLLSNLNVLAAEEKINCTVSELERDKSHFCLIKDNENYYIKEVLSHFNEEDKKPNFFYKNKLIKKRIYSNYELTKTIKKIPKELFEKEINFENQRGLAILTTDEGELYTTRIGYIQENGHYLDIENNKIEEFKIEEVKNPEKIISMYNIYVLDKNKELWRKSKGEWSKLDIENIYDFTYTEEGLVYILSESGFYYGEDKGELNNLQLMNINIEESLYKNKINKKDYEEYVIKSIINEKTRINIYKYHSLEEIIINLENEELLNKDFNKKLKKKINKEYIVKNILTKDSKIKTREKDLVIDSQLITIDNKILKNENLLIYVVDNKLEVVLDNYQYYTITAEELRSVERWYQKEKSEKKRFTEKYSFKYNTKFITIFKNDIKTKYHEKISFKNKEQEIQYGTKYLGDMIDYYQVNSEIIHSTANKNHYFILRANGVLTIIDKKTKELKKINSVNLIDSVIGGMKIMINPKLNYKDERSIYNYEILEVEDIKEDEEVFVFIFRDFKSLEHENIKKYLRYNTF